MTAPQDAEARRLAALERYGVLDTPPEAVFERLAALAARLFGVPIALVSLADADRLWFKACHGLSASEVGRDGAFCDHAIRGDEVLVVPDARLDPRFASSPLVTGPAGLRFYAGAPLVAPDGAKLGTLCVLDTAPRNGFSEHDQASLGDLAALVVDELELRLVSARAAEGLEHERAVVAARDRALAEALRAGRLKSEFLATMSHELRTPLNAIIGFSELLSEQFYGPLNGRQLEYVTDIGRAGEHLLSLINDVLDLSKIEAGEMRLDLERLDLAAELRTCLALVEERAHAAGLTLTVSIGEAGALGEVYADDRKLRQVVVNLLSNAVKFTPAGGRVGLSARTLTDSYGDLPLVEISVSDTGIGIAPEDQGRLFTPFTQVDGSLSRRHEGTGLGLALSRRLAELHGGTIGVVSAPGEGSTFTVLLPAAPARPGSG